MKRNTATVRSRAPLTAVTPATGSVKSACDAQDAEMLLDCRPKARVVRAGSLGVSTGISRPTARLEIELAIPAGNNPGLLAQVLYAVAGHKVNILAYCTAFDLNLFTILLVPDDAYEAKIALAAAGLNCIAHSVVLVSAESRAGIPAALFDQLSDARIDIRYAYVASLRPPGFCAVFSTVDDQQSLHVLAAADLVQTAAHSIPMG